MAGKGGRKGSQGAIVIRKTEIVEGGHHGGAWKVAYADFVTAMMAFFLLMWLLNATTEDQRKGLADYFSPSNLMSHSSSGTGKPFGGHTAFDDGAMVSDRGRVEVLVGKRPSVDQTEDGDDPVLTEPHHARKGDGVGVGPMQDDQNADDDPDVTAKGQKGTRAVQGPGGPAEVAGQAGADGMKMSAVDKTEQAKAAQEAAQRATAEKAAFETAAEQIKQAVRSDPALADLAKQLAIDMTPAGLRIQILDELKLPMFATGSASPNERARLLVQKVVPILNKLSEPISIAGYTDAQPFPGPDRTNWELSAERANATRRLLVDGGLAEARMQSVTGHADHDLLLPNDPFAPANRRIAILVQRQAPPPPAANKP